ncbi:hypothetical protein EV192_1019 [Actinocrispum wychmicini]|uniref:Uncharacterized protein n=1 Tax=Actinocrispum wychmicini TaxID=1213861 RepID=A0A4R2KCM8_9PSEU|nr:hypothetical protein EV192_1019 [Actinocrispum wychmicini]
MHVDAIAALAWRFEAGQLSGDEYLRYVDLERATTLPPHHDTTTVTTSH